MIMIMSEGWFKVHRGWMENPVFKDDSERLCWLWLIEKAAWHPTSHDVKGRRCDVPRGSFFVTLKTLSTRFGWSTSRARRFMSTLEKEHMIRHENHTGKTQVTICNYEKYQHGQHENHTETTLQSTRKRKKPLKKEESIGPTDISEVEIHMEKFRQMYLKVQKPNWTSKDETVRKYLALAIERDGLDTVLLGTQRYTEDCFKENRPAYNPQKFLSQGLYKGWAEKPAPAKYNVGFL